MFVDLHSHTSESDGSLSPVTLLQIAAKSNVNTLAITDHDTLGGYDSAFPLAEVLGIDLICGVEISAKDSGESIHILAYFIAHRELSAFRSWLCQLQDSRHDRNLRLASRLGAHGIDIKIEEVNARGRSIAGRPHFAQIIVEKGYARTIQEAFHEFLLPGAPTYVGRNEPTLIESLTEIRRSGGIASLAHPVRVSPGIMLRLPAFIEAGLNAIEAYHSDHTVLDTNSYLELADRYGLLVTGGSDFHGETKPDIMLGTGREHNLKVPLDIMVRLKRFGHVERSDTTE